MTKAHLVEELHVRLGLPKRESSNLVELILRTIKEGLQRSGQVKISGFGNFVVRDKGARPGRNPHTGETITIAERRVLVFRPSSALKERINDDRHESPA